MNIENFKAGYVSIIGKPNVGKSTIMNMILGEKLSIISPKPQTTRVNIKGFYNTEKAQVIFLDTPGFLEPRYELQEKMLSYITDSVKNSDLTVFVCDASDFCTDYDEKVLQLINKNKKPIIAIINKIDLISEKDLEEKKQILTETLKNSLLPKDIFCISALGIKNSSTLSESVNELLYNIIQRLPYSPPLYSQEDLSDLPLRFFAQEIIREKIFLHYEQEIPYASTVVVEKWSEEENRDVIQANIWIERESQKPIIIGKKGIMIGKVRAEAERDIALLTGRQAVLNLWVKVKYDWRKKNGALNEFGYK